MTFSRFECLIVNLNINEANSGKTVLAVLREYGFSGTEIKRLKQKENGITVNGVHVTVRFVLSANDCLSLFCEDTFEDENPNLVPSDLPISIIYEDDDVIIVDKPPSMPTHPSLGHHNDTLANAVYAEYKRRGNPFVFRPVNRLDGDTSGVVLLAKTHLSAYLLSQAMMKGKIKKRYVAILDGEMIVESEKIHRIENYIKRAENSIIKREVSATEGDGDLAVTNYMCLAVGNGISVVLAEPVTGRTHQLRVHFAGIGHPIIGDDFYGGSLELIERQALHAYSLSFPSPSNGAMITLTAKVPDDMRNILKSKNIKVELQ